MRKKTDVILASARTLFLERGYDGTTLDDVAAASGVAKTTVYNNFSDKEHLFFAVIGSISERSAEIVANIAQPLNSAEPIRTRLHRFGTAVLAGVLQPSVLQLRRLAIAEAPRFPALVAGYWELGPLRTIEILTDGLRRAVDAGELAIDDPDSSAVELTYAIVGPLQDRALLVLETTFAPDEIERHVTHAIGSFMRAHAPGGNPGGTGP